MNIVHFLICILVVFIGCDLFTNGIEWIGRKFKLSETGYMISTLSEEDIFAMMLKYTPFISFEAFRMLSVDQSMEGMKKLATV